MANWMGQFCDSHDLEDGINRALMGLVKIATKSTSQLSLAEWSARKTMDGQRTGERLTVILRPDTVDMGDVRERELTIGCLKFLALDYGDRLQLPTAYR